MYDEENKQRICDGCGKPVADGVGAWVVFPVTWAGGLGKKKKMGFCVDCVADMTYKLEGHAAHGEWALMASNLYGLLCQAVVSGDPAAQNSMGVDR